MIYEAILTVCRSFIYASIVHSRAREREGLNCFSDSRDWISFPAAAAFVYHLVVPPFLH